MTCNMQGYYAELIVCADLCFRGYPAFLVVGGNAGYDLVLDSGKALLRVQVKSTNGSFKDREGVVSFKTIHSSKLALRSNVDIYAFVYAPKKGKPRIAYMNINETNNGSRIYFSLEKRKNIKITTKLFNNYTLSRALKGSGK